MQCYHPPYDDNDLLCWNIDLLCMQTTLLLHYMHKYIYISKHHLLLGSYWLHACEYGGCAHCTSSKCFSLLAIEHFKAPSPIHLYSTTTGHPMDPEQFNIVHKEVNSLSRTIKKAMFICIQDPNLNRNLGKYQLQHIWDHLLQASPTLQLKPSSLPYPTHLNTPS